MQTTSSPWGCIYGGVTARTVVQLPDGRFLGTQRREITSHCEHVACNHSPIVGKRALGNLARVELTSKHVARAASDAYRGAQMSAA